MILIRKGGLISRWKCVLSLSLSLSLSLITGSDSHVVDGSGTVTGLAFYKLQQELVAAQAEKEESRLKTAKAMERINLIKTESEKQR